MRLDGSPVSALFPGTRLVVGCEDDPDEAGCVRLYLDSRHLRRYVLVPPESASEARRAWATTFMSHLFARLEPDESVFVEVSDVQE